MKAIITFALLCIATITMAQNKQIQEAMANYDYETAILLIKKEKPTPTLLYQKGKALQGLSRTSEALNAFKEVIVLDSLNQRAIIEAAECCKTLTRDKEALKYYRNALFLNPQNKYVRLQYITLLCDTRQFQEALGESSVMSETDSSAVVLHLQARSMAGMEYPTEVVLGSYHNIQEKYPDDYLAAVKLGSIYNDNEMYNYAIEATEKYREKDTTNILVNRQNALAYCLSKNYDTAIKRYEYLLSQNDTYFSNYYYLGICYFAKERHYDVHDMLEIARKSAPNNANLLYYLGLSNSRTSWKKEGVKYMEEAIKLSLPNDTTMRRLYQGMAECYELAAQYKEQINTLKECYYKYSPMNHQLLYKIAYVYKYFLHDTENTEKYLQLFLNTRPKVTKEKQPTQNSKSELQLGLENYYNAAESLLNEIRKKDGSKEGPSK